MELFDMVYTIRALAAEIRDSADLSAEELAEARKATVVAATACGADPQNADRIADEAERVLVAFADAVRAAGRAAEAVVRTADEHTKMFGDKAARMSAP